MKYAPRRFIVGFVDGTAEFNDDATPPAMEFLSLYEHECILNAEKEKREKLRVALSDVFKLIDDEFLVRNTDLDQQHDWAIRMLEPMHRLATAYQTLAADAAEDV